MGPCQIVCLPKCDCLERSEPEGTAAAALRPHRLYAPYELPALIGRPSGHALLEVLSVTNQYQTAQLKELDALHHLHPFTTHSSLRAAGARVIVRGDGPYIWDSEGKRVLDGMAGLWTC